MEKQNPTLLYLLFILWTNNVLNEDHNDIIVLKFEIVSQIAQGIELNHVVHCITNCRIFLILFVKNKILKFLKKEEKHGSS